MISTPRILLFVLIAIMIPSTVVMPSLLIVDLLIAYTTPFIMTGEGAGAILIISQVTFIAFALLVDIKLEREICKGDLK